MGTDEPALRLAGLRRDYGERTALDGVGFELAAGESLVVLGPNGAGKTTLLRILATLLRPSGGEVRVLGCALPREAWKLRGRVGYLGHEPLLYRDLSGRENLRFHARLHGIEARRGRGAHRRAARRDRDGAPRRRAGRRALRRDAPAARRSAAASCTSPSCCCSTSPTPTSTPRAASWPAGLIGPGDGRTRVLVTHDPERVPARGRPGAAARHRRGGGGCVTPSRAAFAAILAKDLRSELRTLQSLPAMALFAVTTFVIFRFGLDRTTPLRQPRRRRALGDAAVRRRARHQPPLRRRARGGRLRRDPPRPDRPHRALRRQGGGAARLPAGARADRRPGLRPLLPRLRRRPAAARRGPPPRRPRPRRHRHADLLDGGQLARPRPARAAGPAAPGRAADDRRDRRHRPAAGRWAVPVTTASAPGWRSSAYTI